MRVLSGTPTPRLLAVGALTRGGGLILALVALAFGPTWLPAEAPTSRKERSANRLSRAEVRAGWKLLFDGRTATGWRGFRQAGFPTNGWVIADGCLKCLGRNQGDLITTQMFSHFEFRWEWRLAPGGNSGVKYFVNEERAGPGGALANEYQMVDDDNYGSRPLDPKHKTAGWYDVLAPRGVRPRPPGQFNESRLVVRDRRVEHWLNGRLALAYDPQSPETAAAIRHSKFSRIAGYGIAAPTPLVLQDHASEVWFRNLKIRELPRP